MSDIQLIIQEDHPYTTGIIKPYEGEYAEECSICISNDAFTYKSWIELKCGHCFHRHCIDLWLENHRTCPICVQDVDGRNRSRQYNYASIEKCFYNCMGCFILLAFIIVIIYCATYKV